LTRHHTKSKSTLPLVQLQSKKRDDTRNFPACTHKDDFAGAIPRNSSHPR
jgi:hypothetical protein